MFPEICRGGMRNGDIGACPCINSGSTQLLCARRIVRLVCNLPSVTACDYDAVKVTASGGINSRLCRG